MCGIAGGFSFGAGLPVANTIVTLLNEFQRHRGPDGEGVWLPTTNGASSGIAA